MPEPTPEARRCSPGRRRRRARRRAATCPSRAYCVAYGVTEARIRAPPARDTTPSRVRARRPRSRRCPAETSGVRGVISRTWPCAAMPSLSRVASAVIRSATLRARGRLGTSKASRERPAVLEGVVAAGREERAGRRRSVNVGIVAREAVPRLASRHPVPRGPAQPLVRAGDQDVAPATRRLTTPSACTPSTHEQRTVRSPSCSQRQLHARAGVHPGERDDARTRADRVAQRAEHLVCGRPRRGRRRARPCARAPFAPALRPQRLVRRVVVVLGRQHLVAGARAARRRPAQPHRRRVGQRELARVDAEIAPRRRRPPPRRARPRARAGSPPRPRRSPRRWRSIASRTGLRVRGEQERVEVARPGPSANCASHAHPSPIAGAFSRILRTRRRAAPRRRDLPAVELPPTRAQQLVCVSGHGDARKGAGGRADELSGHARAGASVCPYAEVIVRHVPGPRSGNEAKPTTGGVGSSAAHVG